MKYAFVLLSFIVLLGCDQEQESTVLDGVWRSDKELTVQNFSVNSKLTPARKDFLENNLGKLYISFRGNETRVFFDDVPEKEVEAQSFKVILNDDEKIVITVHSEDYGRNTITYYWIDDCIYMIQKEWGYSEYFCREDT